MDVHWLSVVVLLTMLFGAPLRASALPLGGKRIARVGPRSPLLRVAEAVHYDVGPSLASLASRLLQPLPAGASSPAEVPTRPLHAGIQMRGFGDGDAALQDRPGTGSAIPVPLANFAGLSNADNQGQGAGIVAPPDSQGDIGYDPGTGRRYYVQWVNKVFAIWDVDSGARIYGPARGSSLWAGFGGLCETTNNGDPISLFDNLDKRWLMAQFAFDSTANQYLQCIAVSAGADLPTTTWYRYAFAWINAAGIPVMNDYVKFGVWPDGYYMSANQFNGVLFAGSGVAAFERAKMVDGLPARMIYFDLPDDPGGLLPADWEGAKPPPAGAPNTYLAARADEWGASQDAYALWAFHADWDTPADATFAALATLPVAAFNGNLCQTVPTQDCIPQPNTQGLDALGDRAMYRLQYRNFGAYETLVTNLAVNVAPSGTRAGIRWAELRKSGTSWSIYQQSTYAPDDTENRWMASIAMDQAGNIGLGYSVSSGSLYPSIRYTGRLAGDPLGLMTQGEATLWAGSAAQSGTNRWGDYTTLSVDPTDDCTFWYTNEYSTGGWNWGTRIGSFKFPNCFSPGRYFFPFVRR